jgi:hypothetical protein
LTNRVVAGNRRREAWRDLLMSGGVIPDIEE